MRSLSKLRARWGLFRSNQPRRPVCSTLSGNYRSVPIGIGTHEAPTGKLSCRSKTRDSRQPVPQPIQAAWKCTHKQNLLPHSECCALHRPLLLCDHSNIANFWHKHFEISYDGLIFKTINFVVVALRKGFYWQCTISICNTMPIARTSWSECIFTQILSISKT